MTADTQAQGDLRSALERVTNNFRLLLASKPVRDVEETLAEADRALQGRGTQEGEPSDERAAFEAWRRRTTKMANKDDSVAREGFGDDAPYADRTTRSMWLGYKAGRAALAQAQKERT